MAAEVARIAPFAFATAGQVVFGRGKTSQLASLVAKLGGTKVMVVTGRSVERAAPAIAVLEEASTPYVTFCVDKEVSSGGRSVLPLRSAVVRADHA